LSHCGQPKFIRVEKVRAIFFGNLEQLIKGCAKVLGIPLTLNADVAWVFRKSGTPLCRSLDGSGNTQHIWTRY